MTNFEIASTITAQIGNRAFSMIGARGLLAIEKGLQFKVAAQNCAKVNTIRVTLDEGADTYGVTFYSVRGTKVRVVCELADVHAAELCAAIEDATGLALAL